MEGRAIIRIWNKCAPVSTIVVVVASRRLLITLSITIRPIRISSCLPLIPILITASKGNMYSIFRGRWSVCLKKWHYFLITSWCRIAVWVEWANALNQGSPYLPPQRRQLLKVTTFWSLLKGPTSVLRRSGVFRHGPCRVWNATKLPMMQRKKAPSTLLWMQASQTQSTECLDIKRARSW